MDERSEVSARAMSIWIDDEDGARRPIKDLVRPGRFLLIAGEEGESWCEAARSIADAEGLPLDAVRIGHLDGELYDPRCTWLRYRGSAPRGRSSCARTALSRGAAWGPPTRPLRCWRRRSGRSSRADRRDRSRLMPVHTPPRRSR